MSAANFLWFALAEHDTRLIKNFCCFCFASGCAARRLAEVKEFANLTHVGACHESGLVKIAFALLALLCQDVAMISVFPFDFPCAGERETLFRRGIGLNFRHFC